MQQKTKFIIFISLICFISLLFLPVEVWGTTINTDGGGGGGDECTQTCVSYTCSGCPDASYTGPGAYYCPGYWDGSDCCSWSCKSCDKLVPKTIPSWCFDNTTATTKEKEKKKYYYNTCNRSGWPWNWTWKCVLTSHTRPGDDVCQVDADCGNGGTTTPKYSCNTSTWECSENSNGVYSSLSVCEDNCKPSGTLSCPGNDYCYACNKTTYHCYKSSAGPYATLNMCKNHCREPSTGPPSPPPPPETEPCMINYFELPERAWVGYPITGKWSASDWCDDCDVDCTPYPGCVWKEDSIGTGFDEYKFTIEQSGTYNYTLTCYGEGGIDERTETATVEALNLPWWREIIPVLQGFLRGIWG